MPDDEEASHCSRQWEQVVIGRQIDDRMNLSWGPEGNLVMRAATVLDRRVEEVLVETASASDVVRSDIVE